MNKAEIAELLTTASVLDGRELNQPMVNVWFEVIGHLTVSEATSALYAHFRESRFKVLPADIMAQVRISRERRRESEGVHPPPPPGKRWAVDVIETDPRLAVEQ